MKCTSSKKNLLFQEKTQFSVNWNRCEKFFKFVSYSISLQLQGTFLLVQLITM